MTLPPTERGDRAVATRDALVSGALVLLALAAFDDITTDRAQTFVVERLMLAGCAVWFVALSWRLVRQGRTVLGLATLGFIALGIWGQAADLSRLRNHSIEYAASLATLGWLVLLAGILAFSAWRASAGRTAAIQ